jgi:hypothetical protein
VVKNLTKKNILIKTNNAGAWDELYPITAAGNVKTTDGSDVEVKLGTKVDKVSGKKLSTEDYTTTEKNKLSGIATGANNYTHPSTHPSTMITMGDSKTLEQYKSDVSTQLTDLTKFVAYGVATGSANTYAVTLSPTPSAYVDGLALSVKINVQNTGASTINVNGLGARSILKGNGNAVSSGNLKAGSIYTLRYNGTAFILQGEGGEYGTAGQPQILSGYTIGTENGVVAGTMANRTFAANGGNYTGAVSAKGDGGGSLCVEPQQGYYEAGKNAYGFGSILVSDPNYKATNIKTGTSIFGVAGAYNKEFGKGDGVPFRRMNSPYNSAPTPQIVWNKGSTSSLYADPYIGDNYLLTIYGGRTGAVICRYELTTGNEISGISRSTWRLLGDKSRKCVFAVNDMGIYRYDEQGNLAWSNTTAAVIDSSFKACCADQDRDFIYVINANGVVYKVNKDNGATVWQVQYPLSTYGYGVITTNDSWVYITSVYSPYVVRKLDRANGAEVLTYTISQRPSLIAVGADNLLYTLSNTSSSNIFGWRDTAASYEIFGADNHNGACLLRYENGNLIVGATGFAREISPDGRLYRFWNFVNPLTSAYGQYGVDFENKNGVEYCAITGYSVTYTKTCLSIDN